MAEIEARGVDAVMEDVAQELAKEAANRWFSEANETLIQAGDQLDYDVFPVVQSSQPPQWDESEQAYIMAWPHVAAPYFEYGTTHEEAIQGNPVLSFEWPEMEGEPFGDTDKTWDEVFEDTWPRVFLPEVQPEGIPRIGYLFHGQREARRWLNQQEG